MKLESSPHYFVYLVTNETRTELLSGVTGDLSLRLYEYEREWRKLIDTPASDKFCRHLVWWEHVTEVGKAITRGKQIGEYSRKKQEQLITTSNPGWEFLNKKMEKDSQLFI